MIYNHVNTYDEWKDAFFELMNITGLEPIGWKEMLQGELTPEYCWDINIKHLEHMF